MKDFYNSYNSPTPTSSELVDCLEAKERSIEQFLALTECLRDRLMSQDLSEVERLLNQRQGLIRTIDRIDDRIQGMRSRPPLDRRWQAELEKKKVASVLNHIRDISEKARTVDKECTDRMAGWRNQARGQMSGMRDTLKAVHGYAQKPMRPPKFLDVTR